MTVRSWIKQRVLAVEGVALCVVRKWWRPVVCVGLAASVWVNLVIIPWSKGQPIEFASASAFVAAVVAALAVREVGKAWAVKHGSTPE